MHRGCKQALITDILYETLVTDSFLFNGQVGHVFMLCYYFCDENCCTILLVNLYHDDKKTAFAIAHWVLFIHLSKLLEKNTLKLIFFKLRTISGSGSRNFSDLFDNVWQHKINCLIQGFHSSFTKHKKVLRNILWLGQWLDYTVRNNFLPKIQFSFVIK